MTEFTIYNTTVNQCKDKLINTNFNKEIKITQYSNSVIIKFLNETLIKPILNLILYGKS